MGSGRFTVAAATFLACLGSGENAIAVGRLLGPSASDPAVHELRLAVALAPRQTTSWWTIELSGPKRRVALVVPAPPGAAFDPVSGLWFEALERATAPRIAFPGGPSVCGGGPGGSPVHDTSEAPGATVLGTAEFAVLSSFDEVNSFAQARGLMYTAEDRASLLPFRHTHRFVAFSYDVPETGGWTEALRMTSRRPEAKLELNLLGDGAKLPITLFTIAGGRAELPPAREYQVVELEPVWNLSRGLSDYPERRSAWLDSRRESSWLIESAGDGVFYDWRVLPDGSGAIQPVASSYFAPDPAGACLARVLAAKSDGRRVAPACAPGALGIVEVASSPPACVELPAVDEIDPESLRCGALDDLALALADQAPDRVWVTRHRGVFLAPEPQDLQIDTADPTLVSPIVSANTVDATGCGSTGGSSGQGGAPGASGTGSGSGGWGGVGGQRDPRPRDPHGHTVHDEGSSVEVGCTTSGGDADCGGDTSSGEDGDSCSGDSGSGDSEGCSSDSSDDESDGDDCGGDSSGDGGDDCGGDSSSDGGDDCSSDSSSEGGDDCSGDSSGGDDCSGDSGSGDCAGGETASMSANVGVGAVRQVTAAVCSLPRPRRFRPRVSAVTLVLCAVALCMRRAGRSSQIEGERW